MADLKAMLAAKRAAENKTTQAAPATQPLPASFDKVVATMAPADAQNLPAAQKQEVAAPAVEKPLTFAEKMALKRQTGSTSSVAAPAGNVATPTAASSTEGSTTQAPQPTIKPVILDEDKLRTGMLDPTLDAHPVLADKLAVHDASVEARDKKMEEAILTDSVDPIIAQAYADISAKINLLESLEDTALEGAMKELKKALMANPNAVSLMLDTDYYKMVMALRKITREAAIEAAVEKKAGRTKAVKTAPLSAEQIAAVFEEL